MSHYYLVTYKNSYKISRISNYGGIVFSKLQNGRKDRHGRSIASVSKYDYGKLTREEWWENNQRHRLFLPAGIYYDHSFKEEWWFKGNKYNLFDENKYLILQILIKFLYFNSKNVNVWSPKNLGGKCTKKFLMRLITKN